MIGDVFQQHAVKYAGISRGIPLSNSNQLWGLLWGILVFSELHGRGASLYLQVIGGSLLMMLGAGAIALSSATGKEQLRWKEAAEREGRRYGVLSDYVEARMAVVSATGILLIFATMARVPQMSLHWGPALALSAAMLAQLPRFSGSDPLFSMT